MSRGRAIEWRALRLAIGLTQQQMGELLCVTQEYVSMLERGHRTPDRATLTLLRAWLTDPELCRRLAVRNIAHPFPEDVSDAES